MPYSYPHMCRSDHIQIGHHDSEHERCPLCRLRDALCHLMDERDVTYAVRVARAREALASVSDSPAVRATGDA
jgi:hypothetical protein